MVIDFTPVPYIEITWSDIDELAADYFKLPYETLRSDDSIRNDTHDTFPIWEYEDLLSDIVNWDEYLEAYLKNDFTKNNSYNNYDGNLIPWQWVLTLLIRDGILPKHNYIVDMTW